MRTETGIDVGAYLQRIGYAARPAATIEALRALHELHPRSIAFENLDPLLGWPVRLDPASLEAKLVRGGRGGYCFEQNLLFAEVLTAFGFAVDGLAARVCLNAPIGTTPPRSHMLLLVRVAGERWIADVGFGGQTPTAPLQLDSDAVQATPNGSYRIARDGEAFELLAQIGGEWKLLYRFDLQRQFRSDYEVANWYVSTHPESPFVTTLIAARADRGHRYTLRNNEFAIHHASGRSERHRLANLARLRAVLETELRIRLPSHPDVDRALQRVIDAASDSGNSK